MSGYVCVEVVVNVVGKYSVLVTVVEIVVGTTVDVVVVLEHRQYPAFLSAVWMQFFGGPPLLGKQAGPRTVLVLVKVFGTAVVVVRTANVDVETAAAVVVIVGV